MGVLIRSGNWHYRFNYNGKICSGRCVGCTTERQALAYEQSMRRKAEEIHGSKNIKALLENYREELVGGDKVLIAKAHDMVMSKAGLKQCVDKYFASRKARWDGFVEWMKKNKPEIKYMHQVVRQHVEAYLVYIRDRNGDHSMLSSSLQLHKRAISFIFRNCGEDAGIYRNPCENIVLAKDRSPKREIFTEDELRRIIDHVPADPLIGSMFVVAGATGLSCVDICHLRWAEVDMRRRLITRVRQKTNVELVIPISDGLMTLLGKQYALSGNGEYVFPELPGKYKSNTVAGDIAKYLAACDIETTVPTANGRRKSIKGIHSMRHVFCYYAGKSGIPINIVQGIVGHMDSEMTKHYMAHSTIDDKRLAISMMPSLLIGNTESPNVTVDVEVIIQKIRSASPAVLARINAILNGESK